MLAPLQIRVHIYPLLTVEGVDTYSISGVVCYGRIIAPLVKSYTTYGQTSSISIAIPVDTLININDKVVFDDINFRVISISENRWGKVISLEG